VLKPQIQNAKQLERTLKRLSFSTDRGSRFFVFSFFRSGVRPIGQNNWARFARRDPLRSRSMERRRAKEQWINRGPGECPECGRRLSAPIPENRSTNGRYQCPPDLRPRPKGTTASESRASRPASVIFSVSWCLCGEMVTMSWWWSRHGLAVGALSAPLHSPDSPCCEKATGAWLRVERPGAVFLVSLWWEPFRRLCGQTL